MMEIDVVTLVNVSQTRMLACKQTKQLANELTITTIVSFSYNEEFNSVDE